MQRKAARSPPAISFGDLSSVSLQSTRHIALIAVYLHITHTPKGEDVVVNGAKAWIGHLLLPSHVLTVKNPIISIYDCRICILIPIIYV